MASSAQLRLMSDLRTIINEPPEGCSASPLSDDNLMFYISAFSSPRKGTQLITYDVCAVYRDGTLCMDIIQDAWSPCFNVSTILTSVQSLLTDPNAASPANPDAAHMYQHDIQAYNKRVHRSARHSIESL